jgi:hypothetical protein
VAQFSSANLGTQVSSSVVIDAILDRFRCPPGLVTFSISPELNPIPGYFRFGPGIGYGPSILADPSAAGLENLPDLSQSIEFNGSIPCLPFDPAATIDNLRLERYPIGFPGKFRSLASGEALRRVYYSLRPALPGRVRQSLQRIYFRDWRNLTFPQWPVDTSVENILEQLLLVSMKAKQLESMPFIWFWPEGAPAAVSMTHDVETTAGLTFVPRLLDVDDHAGIKSSFQLVPEERYEISPALRELITKRGFEVNVHGFNHDGNLFGDRKTFLEQVAQINRYVKDFGADGFRSACMYRNIDWYYELDVSYDMSVPNTARLEPQRGGCGTVFPYFIGKILELPLTAIQDYSLFHILGEYSIDLWIKQIDLIAAKHGLISFIVHPDYIQTDRTLSVYQALLAYLSGLRTRDNIWIALAGEINRWWRERSAMNLTLSEGRWRIEGRGSERARIAFARIQNDRLVYTVENSSEAAADRGSIGNLMVPHLAEPPRVPTCT